MFPAISSKSYEPDVDPFGWQAGSVLERNAIQRGGIRGNSTQSGGRPESLPDSPELAAASLVRTTIPSRPGNPSRQRGTRGATAHHRGRAAAAGERTDRARLGPGGQAAEHPDSGGHRRYPAQGVEQVLATMTAAGEPRVDD